MNIVFVSPGIEHDGNTIRTKSLGGSETAAIQLAETLAKTPDAFGAPNKIVVFSPTRVQSVVNGVIYMPISMAPAYTETADIDLLIVSRFIEFLQRPHNAKVCYLWCHDLALRRAEQMFRNALHYIDKILVMSEFQKAQYKEVYGLPDDAFIVIRNGIDLSLFPKMRDTTERNKGLMVYAARPERGLDNLVANGGIMDKLADAMPGVRLYVAHYDNTTEQMRPYYEGLWAQLARKKNCNLVGNLTKNQLYDLYSHAWLYVYPTPARVSPEFDEISCISAMEARACGLPFLSTNRGALPETVAEGTGILIQGNGQEVETQDRLVAEIKALYDDDERWKMLSATAYQKSGELSWDDVAGRIISEADARMRSNTENKASLYRHFYHNSDIIACLEMDKIFGSNYEGEYLKDTHEIRRIINREYRFINSREEYAKHNDKAAIASKPSDFQSTRAEPRFLTLLDFIRNNRDKLKKVLDFGCAYGHQTIHLANEFPEMEFVGVDVSPSVCDMARRFQREYGNPQNVSFHVGDEHTFDASEFGNDFDLVILGEVLEHALSPEYVVTKAEEWCKEGGAVFITTPSGPWEAASYDTYPYRLHIRHIEGQDLIDMFGAKKNVNMFYKPLMKNQNGEPLGHHYVIYENDYSHNTGNINMARKLSYQRPRQTVSVCMIAYNEEGMLNRCLKSIKPVADEIIVAVDPKTNDTTKEICLRHGARVIEGIDPIINGFDEARNHSIKKARMEWILWIDADEELHGSQMLISNLRNSVFNGFAIQQHHLSVDPPIPMKPDLPVRLFRNGKGIKFFGMCHEHPELALNEGVGFAHIMNGVRIAHDGYLTEAVRRNRFLRNIELVKRDRDKYPERKLGHFLWLRDLIHLCRYKAEGIGSPINGTGVLDGDIQFWATEAIRLYEERFLDNPSDPMSPEALTYYSEANRLMGNGVPFRLSFNVQGQEPKEVIGQFRDSDKLSEFLSGLVKAMVKPFEGRYI